MDKMIERKRCSCGGYGMLTEWGSNFASRSIVRCSRCDKCTEIHISVADATEEWNKIAEAGDQLDRSEA